MKKPGDIASNSDGGGAGIHPGDDKDSDDEAEKEMPDIVNEVDMDGEERKEISGENKAAAVLDKLFTGGQNEDMEVEKEDKVYGVAPRPASEEKENGAGEKRAKETTEGQIGPAMPIKVAGTYVPSDAKVVRDKEGKDVEEENDEGKEVEETSDNNQMDVNM